MPRHNTDAVRTALLEFIEGYTAQHGFPPTGAEMGAATGRTKQAISGHLLALEIEGRLKRGPGPRTVRVVKREEDMATAQPEQSDDGLDQKVLDRLMELAPSAPRDVAERNAAKVAAAMRRQGGTLT